MKTVIWHDQESETVRQRLRDVDKAHGMIQEVGSRGRVQNNYTNRVQLFLHNVGLIFHHLRTAKYGSIVLSSL